MDIATLIGVIISIGAITWAMWEQTHGHLMAFYSTEGFVLVLGGSVAAVMLSMPMGAVVNVMGYLKTWLMGKEIACHQVVKQLVEYAEVARREGVLTLEKQVQEQKDPFLKKGLQLLVDGMDCDTIESTLRIQIDALAERHKHGKKFFELLGKYGPGFGLIATLIGQVAMFRNMGGDSAAIGKALAVALLGTLYGCILCNVISGPIADKLHLRSAEEQFYKDLILTGIKCIQAGDNPRIVEMKLQAFLSSKELRHFTPSEPAKQ